MILDFITCHTDKERNEEINSAINKIMSGDEYKDLPVGPIPALIAVRPQILIYNPDDERKPR